MHHTPRAPYRLAAPLLALTAALAGCGGGGSSDSGGGTTPPTPTQQIDVAFTSPSAANNVHDINTPVYLEVRVDVNGNPAANNNPVAFSGGGASFAPVQAMTVGGKATSTLQGNQIGPLQVAFAFRRAALAQRQKPGQPRPSQQIGRQRQPFHRAVGQHQPRACDQFRQGGG